MLMKQDVKPILSRRSASDYGDSGDEAELGVMGRGLFSGCLLSGIAGALGGFDAPGVFAHFDPLSRTAAPSGSAS